MELGQVPDYMLNKTGYVLDLASIRRPRNLQEPLTLAWDDLDKGVRSDMKGKKAADMVD